MKNAVYLQLPSADSFPQHSQDAVTPEALPKQPLPWCAALSHEPELVV